MNKNIILGMMFLLLISFVSAEQQSFGTHQKNTCIDLIQTCSNCTFINTTAITAKGVVIIEDINMSRKGTRYNYTLCNTTTLGEYIINMVGDVDGINTVVAANLFITPSGDEFSTGQGILYSFLFVILVIIFIISSVSGYKLNGKNEIDMGGLVQINLNKYLKIGLFFLSYLLLIFISLVTWKISEAFLFLTVVSTVFNFFFIVLMALLGPVFIAFVAYAIIKSVLDWRLDKLTKQGLKPYKGDKW